MAEVIRLSDRRRLKTEQEDKKEEQAEKLTAWEEIERRNLANMERVKKEKAKHNKKVLKSYRIK